MLSNQATINENLGSGHKDCTNWFGNLGHLGQKSLAYFLGKLVTLGTCQGGSTKASLPKGGISLQNLKRKGVKKR